MLGFQRLLFAHRFCFLAPATLQTKCMFKGCDAKLTREHWEKLARPKDLQRCVALFSILPPPLFLFLLDNAELTLRSLSFKYFYMKSFIEHNPKLAFCPNPLCENAVSSLSGALCPNPQKERRKKETRF